MQPACHGGLGSKPLRISGGCQAADPVGPPHFYNRAAAGEARVDAAQGAMQEDCPTGGGDSAAVHDHELDAIR
jgi:hypothetical protein